MSSVLIQSPKFQGEIELKFNPDGWLVSFEIRAQLDAVQYAYFRDILPVHLSEVTEKYAKSSVSISYHNTELTFEMFWNTYKYKVGNKNRARKLWDSYTEAEKLSALTFVEKYDRFLAAKRNMEKCYPETYLHQRRWDNQA